MRIDDRQRLVEHDDVHILADETAPERNLLLGVGGQTFRAPGQHPGQFGHFGNRHDARLDVCLIDPAIAQRKGEIVIDAETCAIFR